MAPTFLEATAVKTLDSHTYSANFLSEWCIGSVPHGGVVTSTFLRTAATHFSTTLKAQNQPHTISLHLEFLRRTQEGPATLAVRDVKLGRQTSTIHIALSQDGREEVVGYLTHSNIATETGPSLKTLWSLHPSPLPPPTNFVALLADGGNAAWAEQKNKPFVKFRKVSNHVRYFLPRGGQVVPGVVDQWACFESGETLTNEGVGFLADHFPSVVDALWPRENGGERPPTFWYPTVALNLDVKKALPPEGVKWLFTRARAKCIKNGRMDLEVVIFDEAGDIVALSHHVVLIVSAERNTAARKTGQPKI
ncbi:thioesterase-like superfamily-domain-containing protein [Daldinia caldariorum]|uniref:thioesterase-like superfamily-domain-containing protein n=1 Tax=Daldinia caldariorum TaxID=326644 RepID=UPI002007F181|nr:thioesterase-like superfamily-domain-containing protein [Daldinia caldariorum]KAI1467714.1 thioesterase-like superfamily-domain-containing protein [Daldinia caldariorum]